jgi:uridylate kinase
MQIVIKIGGSILFRDQKIDIKIVKKYIQTIQLLLKRQFKVAVVVGGGKPARDYIAAAQELGLSMSYQDWLGIESARQNARILAGSFSEAYPTPPKSFEELLTAIRSHNIVFVGGLQPGQSTNAVAALIAESIEAEYLFNCSNIDYVYDKDPNKFPEAKKFKELNYETFLGIIQSNEQTPGTYALFDVVGAQFIHRSNIKLCFINGNTPEHIIRILDGESLGTIVHE